MDAGLDTWRLDVQIDDGNPGYVWADVLSVAERNFGLCKDLEPIPGLSHGIQCGDDGQYVLYWEDTIVRGREVGVGLEVVVGDSRGWEIPANVRPIAAEAARLLAELAANRAAIYDGTPFEDESSEAQSTSGRTDGRVDVVNSELLVGDCFDIAGAPSGLVTKVPCDQPHEAVVVARIVDGAPRNAEYPGQSTLSSYFDDECYDKADRSLLGNPTSISMSWWQPNESGLVERTEDCDLLRRRRSVSRNRAAHRGTRLSRDTVILGWSARQVRRSLGAEHAVGRGSGSVTDQMTPLERLQGRSPRHAQPSSWR